MRNPDRLRSAVLLALLAVCPLTSDHAARAATGPALTLTNFAGAAVAHHEIGDDLLARLTHAAPLSPYRLELRDEGGQVVASLGLRTDRFGAAAPSLLWARSGVVGCDPAASPDVAAYRFHDFDQAEAILADRVFTVTALDGAGTEVLTTTLPIRARATPLFFFADAAGCPRWDFTDGTAGTIVGKNVQYAQSARIWAVAYQDAPWQLGDGIQDLRPSYPEGEVESLGPNAPSVGLVSLDLVEEIPAGTFCAIVRLSPAAVPSADQLFKLGDNASKSMCAYGNGAAPFEPWGAK